MLNTWTLRQLFLCVVVLHFCQDLWLLYWFWSNFNRHYLSSSKPLYWQKRKHLSEFCVVFITFRSLLLFSASQMFFVASRSFSWRSCCFSSISCFWLRSSWSFSCLAWSLSPVFLTSCNSKISCLTASSSSVAELSELLGHPPGTGRRKCRLSCEFMFTRRLWLSAQDAGRFSRYLQIRRERRSRCNRQRRRRRKRGYISINHFINKVFPRNRKAYGYITLHITHPYTFITASRLLNWAVRHALSCVLSYWSWNTFTRLETWLFGHECVSA